LGSKKVHLHYFTAAHEEQQFFCEAWGDLHRAVADVMGRLLTNFNMTDTMHNVLIRNVVTPVVKERAGSEMKRIRDEFERAVGRSWIG
jgi:hypothetical protein